MKEGGPGRAGTGTYWSRWGRQGMGLEKRGLERDDT